MVPPNISAWLMNFSHSLAIFVFFHFIFFGSTIQDTPPQQMRSPYWKVKLPFLLFLSMLLVSHIFIFIIYVVINIYSYIWCNSNMLLINATLFQLRISILFSHFLRRILIWTQSIAENKTYFYCENWYLDYVQMENRALNLEHLICLLSF